MRTETRDAKEWRGGAGSKADRPCLRGGRWTLAVAVAVAVAALAAGCETLPVQTHKKPSLAFMMGCRREFDLSMARGDTAGAKKALDELWTRRVKDDVRSSQLRQAEAIRALFESGTRQVEAEDFAGAEASWRGLEQARAKIREDWTVIWNGSGYPDWLEREMSGFRLRLDGARDAFAERVKRRFDESLSAKNWGEAERCIGELGGIGMPEGAMGERLAAAKAAEAAAEAYAGHFGKGEYEAAEGDLSELERLGIDTAARRREWRDAWAADCERRVAGALAARDYAGAEALSGTLGHLGEDTGALAARVHAKRVEDASADFEAALADGRADDAEGHLSALAGLGEDDGEGKERVRQLRLSQRNEEFDRTLGARDYAGAEGLKGPVEELGEDFAPYAERIRLERVADIREGLPGAWERKDVRAVREACGKLAALGDFTGDEEKRLGETFGAELRDAATEMRKASDGVWKPDFEAAEATAGAFRVRWAGVWDGDTGVLDETLRVAKKKFALRAQSSEGPMAENCPEYWLRCSPELLLEEDPEARIEGLDVQVAGVAEGVQQGARGSKYRLVGLYGGTLDVESGPAAPLPRQWIYLLATVHLTEGGGVVLKEIRHAPLGTSRKPPAAEYSRWLDEGGYDFLLENCFRTLAHAPDGQRLAPLALTDWLGGKRTKKEEYAGR